MSRKPVSNPMVLRYVYAILAVVAIGVSLILSSLYSGQQDEATTHDRIALFHLRSVSISEVLVREARTLRTLVESAIKSESSDRSGAAGIHSIRIGYRGTMHSMMSHLQELSLLQEQYGGEIFAASLTRLSNRFNQLYEALDASQPDAGTISVIETLSSIIEQHKRLHKISANAELRELTIREGQRPRFLLVLAVCLGLSVLAVWYLLASLRASLVRQKMAEDDLAESQDRLHHVQKLDALGQLVGGVAHDFNNLLTAILGHTGLLQDKTAGDERFENSLHEIKQASLRAASLTQQLLAFSRRQQLNPRVLSLNDLIKDMETMLHRMVGTDIELSCSYATDLCAVEVDPDRLQQVIMNLISNARDAMPDGGKLSVTTENARIAAGDGGVAGIPAGVYAQLSVVDSGTGMNDYTLERLFEPFFTTKERGDGTGLGLSTVHGIVTGSNGHIDVDSKEGEGSRFDIYFPRSEAALEPWPKAATPVPAQTGSETVLIVDDDQQIRRFVEEGLTSLGYRVLAASGGAAGLRICQTESGAIDVIVSDIVMSGMSGPHFMTSALKLHPDAVAIYISTYTEDTVLRLRRQSPGRQIPFVTKPFELEALSRLIRERLDNSETKAAS